MAADSSFLNGPIPGMSLTTEPGGRPWERPPQLVTVEETIQYYTDKILKNVDAHEEILDVLERGIPVRNFSNILMKMSMMNGKHTFDVGVLVSPVIEELIMTVADMYDVKYIPSIEAVAKKNKVSARQARLAMESIKKQEETPEVNNPEEVVQKGLMARPTATTGTEE